MSPAELQELTDYGLKYHVQLIPYLDGPAHDAFILKYPEYTALREYPDSNYEFCVLIRHLRVVEGMFDDLLAATKAVSILCFRPMSRITLGWRTTPVP